MFEPNYKIVSTSNDLNNTKKCKAIGVCIVTNTPYETSEFNLSSYQYWNDNNIPIQHTSLISLSADDREFMISGIAPIGFDDLNNN
jgi:hypothetical protein|tara:strand:+ start:192 stop:449 length:258 start_codon:yes stop_codon:yes gene_type:complete